MYIIAATAVQPRIWISTQGFYKTTSFKQHTHAQGFIPVGGTCISFAGPVSNPCIPGSTCCYVYPDLGLCTAGTKCPTKFVPEGGLCSGIAGPSPYPCFPGTKCCYVSPDNSQCLRTCKKV
ncbi:hypothetical protein B0H34DRAFT_508885 [Crassisporium funariophilum]|nr:hypothetical protein B0H34DRAFT_508885 [Crassisporium funariophilum]